MSGLAALLTSLAAFLPILGGAIAWLVKRFDKQLDECKAAHAADQALIAKLTFFVIRDGKAIRMLFSELLRLEPKNVTLQNVSTILHTSYDPTLRLEDDFGDLVAKANEALRRAA